MARAALIAGALLLLGGVAHAQDENVAARAFTDALNRYRAAATALPADIGAPARMRPCVERVHRRIPEYRWGDLLAFPGFEDEERPFARSFAPILTRLSLELHAVQTGDPALRSGRTSVRRSRRALAAIAALPPIDVCAEVRRWARGGFEPTPALRRIRRASTERDRVAEGPDTERRIAAMVSRLRELGIPASELAWLES
jgi:hypothetical protein